MKKNNERQHKAEALVTIIKNGHPFARQAEDSLANLYSVEIDAWGKAMYNQNLGRSAGLTFGDYKAAAFEGFHKAANDYECGSKASFKTWLYTNVFSFCNDLAKKNGKRMERELDEKRLVEPKKKDKQGVKSGKPVILSIADLVGDDLIAPQDCTAVPWSKYRESNQIAKRVKEILREKAAASAKTASERAKKKIARRFLDLLDYAAEGGTKESFCEKKHCSTSTIYNNIEALLKDDEELKELYKKVTRRSYEVAKKENKEKKGKKKKDKKGKKKKD